MDYLEMNVNIYKDRQMGGAPTNIRQKGASRTGGKFARKVTKPPAVPKKQKTTMTPTVQPSQRTQQIKATLSGEDADTKSKLGG